jgi:hypothetical protein
LLHTAGQPSSIITLLQTWASPRHCRQQIRHVANGAIVTVPGRPPESDDRSLSLVLLGVENFVDPCRSASSTGTGFDGNRADQNRLASCAPDFFG